MKSCTHHCMHIACTTCVTNRIDGSDLWLRTVSCSKCGELLPQGPSSTKGLRHEIKLALWLAESAALFEPGAGRNKDQDEVVEMFVEHHTPIRWTPIRWTFYYACRYLAENGPQPADMVGAIVWKGKTRGKVTSSGGGGDYAAQMLIGRMKKAGLVRHARSEGSTLWEVTEAGRAEARK